MGMNKSNSSMQLTRAADYGIRVMVALAAEPPGARVSLPALTKATAAPESFLSKVLQALAHAGLINSRRGQSGGFEITEQGTHASVRQVIEVIDGPVTLNACLNEGRACARAAWCPAHPVWVSAQKAMLAVLDAAVICNLAARTKPIASVQPIDVPMMTCALGTEPQDEPAPAFAAFECPIHGD